MSFVFPVVLFMVLGSTSLVQHSHMSLGARCKHMGCHMQPTHWNNSIPPNRTLCSSSDSSDLRLLRVEFSWLDLVQNLTEAIGIDLILGGFGLLHHASCAQNWTLLESTHIQGGGGGGGVCIWSRVFHSMACMLWMEAVNWSLVSSTVHHMSLQEIETQNGYNLGLRVEYVRMMHWASNPGCSLWFQCTYLL